MLLQPTELRGFNNPALWQFVSYALSPLLLNFALECAIRKVQGNQVGLQLNRTHQLLAYADDVNLLGNNVDTIKKNTQTLIYASKHREN
jgi:hypothetical protein